MRLSVSTEGVSIRAEADAAASGKAPAPSSNGAAHGEDSGIRGVIRSLSGKLAGGNGSNGAAKAAPGAVEKVCLLSVFCLLKRILVTVWQGFLEGTLCAAPSTVFAPHVCWCVCLCLVLLHPLLSQVPFETSFRSVNAVELLV